MSSAAAGNKRKRDGAAASTSTDEYPIILYDGVCVLCSRVVRFVIRHDRAARYRFAPMQSAPGRRLLARHGLPLEGWDSFVLIEDGVAHLNSDAFLRIVPRLSSPWPVLLLGRIVPVNLRDQLYDLIARNRYRLFGRRETCLVATPEARARFLELEG